MRSRELLEAIVVVCRLLRSGAGSRAGSGAETECTRTRAFPCLPAVCCLSLSLSLPRRPRSFLLHFSLLAVTLARSCLCSHAALSVRVPCLSLPARLGAHAQSARMRLCACLLITCPHVPRAARIPARVLFYYANAAQKWNVQPGKDSRRPSGLLVLRPHTRARWTPSFCCCPRAVRRPAHPA